MQDDDASIYTFIANEWSERRIDDVLIGHGATFVDVCLLLVSSRFHQTPKQCEDYFERYCGHVCYIDFPEYVPFPLISRTELGHQIDILRRKQFATVADANFVFDVTNKLSRGGLCAKQIAMPKVGELVLLPDGISLLLAIGERLNWIWDVVINLTPSLVMTCTTSGDGLPRSCALRTDGCDWTHICVRCDNRHIEKEIGHWHAAWWNERPNGRATLCKIHSVSGPTLANDSPEWMVWTPGELKQLL